MSTLINILKKKKAGEIKTVNEVTIFSEMLGEDVTVKKKPVSVYMDIMSKHDVSTGEDMNFAGFVPMLNEMIFEFCTMFHDVDAVKEAREYYEATTPRELPELVFEGNINEMSKVFEAITSLYNMDDMESDIKN